MQTSIHSKSSTPESGLRCLSLGPLAATLMPACSATATTQAGMALMTTAGTWSQTGTRSSWTSPGCNSTTSTPTAALPTTRTPPTPALPMPLTSDMATMRAGGHHQRTKQVSHPTLLSVLRPSRARQAPALLALSPIKTAS